MRADTSTAVDIYEVVDGRERLKASVRFRSGYAPELRIPQSGHSLTGEEGDLKTFLSHDVLIAIGDAARANSRGKRL